MSKENPLEFETSIKFSAISYFSKCDQSDFGSSQQESFKCVYDFVDVTTVWNLLLDFNVVNFAAF